MTTEDDRPTLLIVNADDYGLTTGVSEGILRAHSAGIVTSTSVLAVGAAFGSTIDALAASGMGVGAHLALIGEDPPLLEAREIPTLVGRHGFRRSWREFTVASFARRIDPEDVRRELGAQLEQVIAAGVVPTHLDCHQHLQLLPSVADVMLDLGARSGVTALRTPRCIGWAPRSIAVRHLGSRLAARAARRGFRSTEWFTGLEHSGHMTTARLAELLDDLSLADHRSVEIGVHPGLTEDPDRHRFDWGFEWGAELDALCDDGVGARANGRPFRLGTFADLR